jgi:integrase
MGKRGRRIVTAVDTHTAGWKLETRGKETQTSPIGGLGIHQHRRQTRPSSSISQTFERIAARAGAPRIRLDDIRHTHGTLLINEQRLKTAGRRDGRRNAYYGRSPGRQSAGQGLW